MVEYSVAQHLSFDWVIVTYFFLGGLSAGAFFLSVSGNYWKKELEPLAKTAAIVTPIAVAVGMLFLLLELGQPLGAWRLLLTFRPTSAISWGFWFLSIFFVLSAIYAWLLFKGENRKAKKFAYGGLPFAFLVSTYTALILNQGQGKILWQTALLPWMFLVGGLISGVSVVMLISGGKLDPAVLSKLGRSVAWLIVLELAMVASEILILLNHGAGSVATATAKSLIAGGNQFTFLFWGVEVFIGAVLPALILFTAKFPKATQYVASVLLLIGIYVMRYVVVVGGQII